MKYPKVRLIIDILRRVDDNSVSKCGFDMRSWRPSHDTAYPCGTARCIGGHVLLAHPELGSSPANYLSDYYLAVARLAELPLKVAYAATTPPEGNPGWEASLEQAISMLEWLEVKGEVDWERACREAPQNCGQ